MTDHTGQVAATPPTARPKKRANLLNCVRVVDEADGVTRINYDLPDDIHHQAKIDAARAGITLREFLTRALAAASRAAAK